MAEEVKNENMEDANFSDLPPLTPPSPSTKKDDVKVKKNSTNYITILAIVIGVVLVGFGVYRMTAPTNSSVSAHTSSSVPTSIDSSDSRDSKIDSLNNELNSLREELDSVKVPNWYKQLDQDVQQKLNKGGKQ